MMEASVLTRSDGNASRTDGIIPDSHENQPTLTMKNSAPRAPVVGPGIQLANELPLPDSDDEIVSKHSKMHLVCSPFRFGNMVKGLSDKHKKAIEHCGLGGLLHLNPVTLRRMILIKLAKRLDYKNQRFHICGQNIPMTSQDVLKIMDLPIQGLDVFSWTKTKPNINLINAYGSGNKIWTTDLLQILTESKDKEPDDDFIRVFVLFAIGVLLAPTTKDYVDSKYLSVVEDVSNIAKFNWGQFTLTHLLSSIHNFNHGEQVNLQGNLTLLQFWYWEHVHPYSHHGFTYAPIPPPLMARWDESTAKVRTEAGRKNKIDDGIVVMNIAQIIGHTKFDETMPISSANERIHAHEGVSYQPRSLEQSINKQQMEQIVQRMNNNHLVFQNDMGRQFMSLEHKLDAKLLAHGEAIAEIKMGGGVGMRISKLEDDFSELKQEFQELRQLLQANLQSMSKAAYIQEPSSLHPQNCTVFFQQYQFKEEGKEPEEASTRQDKIMADNKVPLDLPTNQIAPHKSAFQDKIMAENKEPPHAPTHQIGPRKPAFDKDYLITTEDTEAFYFLTYSYSKAEVVQIDDYVLTIEHLRKNVTDGFIYDQVINAYAHISSVETDSTSFITTLQARKLLGETGGIDNAKQTTTWANLIANKCIGKNLIFVPMNVNDNHWVLLVLNFLKGEIQILNSLASNPNTRDVVKEHTLVGNIQECIDFAIAVGNVSVTQAINIMQWETEMYSNIPQQTDAHSCGAFVLKYMMAWDGDKMTEHFTQAHIHIFKRKISSALLRSDCNKLRLGSYKDLITKEAYDAKCAEVQQEDMSKAADDDVKEINNPIHASNSHSSDKRGRGRPKKNEAANDDVKEISNPIDASNSNTSNKRKRGRPKKNDKTPMSVKDQLTTASIANRVERPNRRVSNPGPLQLSPYKKF